MSSVNPTVVEFPIEPRSQSGEAVSHEKLRVVVEGPSPVDAQIKKRDVKVYVSFTATKTGQYVVNVFHNDEQIQNSPMTVNVKVKESGEETPAPQIPAAPVAAAGGEQHPVKFESWARDHNGNPLHDTALEISVAGPEEVKEIQVQLKDGKFLFSFMATAAEGKFVLNVKHKGHDIERSPFTLTLTKHTGPGNPKEVATFDS